MGEPVRGVKLHRNLLFALEEQQPKQEQEEWKPGRNPDLLAARDEHIFHRYVYYFRQGGGKFRREYIVKELSKEFYLAESTIGQLLEEHADDVLSIMRAWPATAELNKKWPPQKWTIDP